MSLIKKNIIANFSGKFYQALLSLALVPLYINFLGVESYGMIGIFTMLQAISFLFDIGLGATVTRELARLSTIRDKAGEMRDLTRTLEIIYWCLACFIGLIIIICSSLIADYWVNPEHLKSRSIERTVKLIAIAISLQWPVSFYTGALQGLQRQVLNNIIGVAVNTFRGLGSIMILWQVSASIEAFFLWQILAAIVNVVILAFFLWRKMPPGKEKPVFNLNLLAGVWRFAIGMSGISILATILTQADKIIVSKMVSLEMFGYYSLAGVVSLSLFNIISPIFSAVYPRLIELVHHADQEILGKFYHQSCQLMAVLVFPVATVLALFSYEILLVWTQNPITAQNTYLLLSIMVVTTSITAVLQIPYGLQLAYGWTSLVFSMNLLSVILIVPLMIFLTVQFNAVGGAIATVILNLIYVFIEIPILHKRLLVNEKWRWYWKDLILPISASLVIAGIARFFFQNLHSQILIIVFIALLLFVTIVFTALITPSTRKWIFYHFKTSLKFIAG